MLHIFFYGVSGVYHAPIYHRHALNRYYETSLLLTGHGCFKKRHCDMYLRSDTVCESGASEEDRLHVLQGCPLYDELRRKLLAGIRTDRYGPAWYPDVVCSEANFQRLREFARGWYWKRTRPLHQMSDGTKSVPCYARPRTVRTAHKDEDVE